jgi:hypothetical protein
VRGKEKGGEEEEEEESGLFVHPFNHPSVLPSIFSFIFSLHYMSSYLPHGCPTPMSPCMKAGPISARSNATFMEHNG